MTTFMGGQNAPVQRSQRNTLRGLEEAAEGMNQVGTMQGMIARMHRNRVDRAGLAGAVVYVHAAETFLCGLVNAVLRRRHTFTRHGKRADTMPCVEAVRPYVRVCCCGRSTAYPRAHRSGHR